MEELWLSRQTLAERLSHEVLDVTPRSVERLPLKSKLILGKRRYEYFYAKAMLTELIASAEESIGTPGAELLKSVRRME